MGLFLTDYYFLYRGLSGSSKGSGGGAGGSILINAASVSGFGTIDVRGGYGGSSSGGGGSGGIFAVYHKGVTLTITTLLTGGNGAQPGASGLLYEQKLVKQSKWSKLTLNNNGLASNNGHLSSFVLCQSDQINYVFNEISISGKACLTMRSCSPGRPMVLHVTSMAGDKTGTFVVQQFHDVHIGVTGVSLSELYPQINIDVQAGGTLSVPKALVIGNGISFSLSGSLVGVKQLVVSMGGTVTLNNPGHTGYRITQYPISKCTFDKVHVKNSGTLETKTYRRVILSAQTVQLDHGSIINEYNLPIDSRNRITAPTGVSLNRNDCPHGYEVVALASKTLFNPCGTGEHIYIKSNISYIVQHNISRTLYKRAWKDVYNGTVYENSTANCSGVITGNSTINGNGTVDKNITGNGSINVNGTYNDTNTVNGTGLCNRTKTEVWIRVSYIHSWIIYVIKNETRFNVTYYIACNYSDFTLLPGQVCTFKARNYSYRSLRIHNGATMKFESSKDRNTSSSLKVENLTIYSGGVMEVLTSDFSQSSPMSTSGGTYGGHGGGDTNIQSLYGNVTFPRDYGSAGGGAKGHRGKGGGSLVIETQTLILDGAIKANGDSSSFYGGGGSGGSILVLTSHFSGNGLIEALGGPSSNGGGGGGRIAVHSKQAAVVFKGRYDASGGSGRTAGSSGTIFLRDTTQNYDVIIVHNRGRAPTIFPPFSSQYKFSELRMTSNALFSTGSESIFVGKLVSDGTGKILAAANGLLRVEHVEGDKNEINCNIEIQSQGTMYFKDKIIFNGPGSPNVIVAGLLEAAAFEVSKSRFLRIDSSSKVRTNNITMQDGSLLEINKGSTITKNSSHLPVDIDSLILKPNSRMRFISSDAMVRANYIYMSKGATISTDRIPKVFNIDAETMTMESQSNLDTSGGGFKQGPGSSILSGFGCGHGGEGGGGSGGGKAYGSIFEPNHHGSGNIVRGGGIIHINVKTTLTLNGNIMSNGQHYRNGGTSGGSILVRASTLEGHGKIQTNGGSADSSSGGGAGGRVALYLTNFSPFKGMVSSFGGSGGQYGAPGTVFIREYIIGIPMNTTVINNNKHITTAKTKIMHGTKSSYFIGKLQLVEGATLEVATLPNTQMNIKVNEFDGDGSGRFYVRSNQTLALGSTKAVTSRPFMFPWAMTVEDGATLHLSSKILITQTIAKPSLYLAGRLVGGQEVTVANRASVVVAKTGMIGSLKAFPGKFFFRLLKLSSGGRIRFEAGLAKEMPVFIQSLVIDISYGGTLEGPFLHLKSPQLKIAFNGTVRADGLGNIANKGIGAGEIQTYSGGSYGGCGTFGKCKLYGSLFRTSEFGSGGGGIPDFDKAIGAGGGILQIEAGTLLLNGLISSNGGNGKDKLGGGSGGSVNITVSQKMLGRGLITANGGNAFKSAGAGGGGRVAILVSGQYKFGGLIFSKGGIDSLNSASPGTVYIEEVRAGYRSSQLIFDNRQRKSTSSFPVTLGEQAISSYHFSVLRLLGMITLHLDKNILVEKLITGTGVTIHIQNNVTLEVEPKSTFLKPMCNFEVDRDGEIRLPDTVSFLGERNVLSGTLTNVLNLIIGVDKRIQFLSSARTARFVDGKYTFRTKRGEYRLSSLRIKRNGVVSFENAHLTEIVLTIGTLEIYYNAVLFGSWINIRSSKITVKPGGKIDLSGQGYTSQSGPGAGSRIGLIGTGAGHGGFGARASQNSGTWYGSALNPNISGSGGGSCSSGVGGSGGGHLHLQVVTLLVVDGKINVDGRNGNDSCGGGSGGSIWASAGDIKGNGLITSSGGSSSSGGGGSGGRIALYVQNKYGFEGNIKTLGGSGISPSASGTVYINENIHRFAKKRLWLVNRKFVGILPVTVLSEPSAQTVYFDELKMLGNIRFEIASVSNQQTAIKINEFVADGVGNIAIKPNQIMYAKVAETKETHLIINTNIHIEEGGNLVAASNVTVDGATLTIDGRISNVQHLVVESGSRVQFGIKSQTAQMKGNAFLYLSQPGTQQFATVTLKSGSDFGAPQNLSISAGTMDLKNGVLLKGRFINIKAQSLLIGRGASLSTNNIISVKRYRGAGASSSIGGSGGGHGSVGGQSVHKRSGGTYYGTFYKPYQPGNPGGDGSSSSTGGKGGGVITIKANSILNDGSITSNGGDATGSNAGGGSGGSIFITIGKSLRGSGIISANGGRGHGSGGYGAGGRVSLYILHDRYSFIGTLEALGGVSPNPYQSGGPGTVYTQEIRNKLPYNKLYVDNQNQGWEHILTLHEKQSSCDLDEVHMLRNASLRLSVDQQRRQLKIRKLFGDKNGLIHIYNNQKVNLESQSLVSKPPVNLVVESGGEITFAPKTYLVGQAFVVFILNGTISGVRELYITQKRYWRIKKGAHSVKQPFGTFKLSSLRLQSGSTVVMEDDIVMNVFVGFLNIKFHASLSAHHFRITSSFVNIETGGLLSASGDNTARIAAPPKSSSPLPQGAGAGHATAGGRGKGGAGGQYHGSLFYPTYPGKDGGAGNSGVNGGRAGGFINITSGYLVTLDGTATVAGEHSSPGSGAGGGSGGSILIKTRLFKGYLCCIFTKTELQFLRRFQFLQIHSDFLHVSSENCRDLH